MSCVECVTLLPDETIVPPDVPSYLSSQGTLSERQDVCIRVEAGGGPQLNGHVIDTTGTWQFHLGWGLPDVWALPCPLSKACSASETITADNLTTVLIFCLQYVSFLSPCLQHSTVQLCVQIVWRTAVATPKILTTWSTGLALLEAWSTNNTLLPHPTPTVTQESSMARGHTQPRSATGHPTGSERTLKNFQQTTICCNRTNMTQKVRVECVFKWSVEKIFVCTGTTYWCHQNLGKVDSVDWLLPAFDSMP